MNAIAHKLLFPAAFPEFLRIKFRQGFVRFFIIGAIVNALVFSMLYSYTESANGNLAELASFYANKFTIIGGALLIFWIFNAINKLSDFPIKFTNGSDQFFMLAPFNHEELTRFGLWHAFTRMDSTALNMLLYMPAVMLFFNFNIATLFFVVPFTLAADTLILVFATVCQKLDWHIRFVIRAILGIILFIPFCYYAYDLELLPPLHSFIATKLFLNASYWLGFVITGQNASAFTIGLISAVVTTTLGLKFITRTIKFETCETEYEARHDEKGVIPWAWKHFGTGIKWVCYLGTAISLIGIEIWWLTKIEKPETVKLEIFSPSLFILLLMLCILLGEQSILRLQRYWLLPSPSYKKILTVTWRPSILIFGTFLAKGLLFWIVAARHGQAFHVIFQQIHVFLALAAPLSLASTIACLTTCLLCLKLQQLIPINSPFLNAMLLLMIIPTVVFSVFLLLSLICLFRPVLSIPALVVLTIISLMVTSFLYDRIDLA